MTNPIRVSARRGGLIAICLAGFVATAGQAAEEEEIIVTGSRIARPELTASSPIMVIDEEAIKLSNTANIEEFLRQSPQFAQGIGSNTNNGNEGGATIDLRNLGEQRTLVLVNGKRFVPFDYQGFVDISMIPTSLVQRVEVITGGASAVYGADAVAGVVNFILKDDFQGIEANASTGITEQGDGESYNFDVTMGGDFAEDRGNAVLNVGYSKKNVLYQDARNFSKFALDNLLEPGGSFTSPGSTVFDSSYTGDPDEGCVQFAPDGSVVPFPSCVSPFNYNAYNLLQAPQILWTATALADYDITDNLQAYARASFANNRVDTVIAPTGTFFNTFSINYLENPFLSQSAIDRWTLVDAEDSSPNDGLVDAQIGRRFVEFGTRDSLYENTAYQFVAGLKGKIFTDQSWEVFGQYGRTSRNQNFVNDNNVTKVRNAVDAVDDGSGNIVCRINADADPNNDDPGCVAANLFGEGNLDPAFPAYAKLGLVEIDKTDQMVFGGSLSGDTPLQIPTASGNVAYAAGVEFRREKGRARPDDNYLAGNAPGFGSSANVDAEINIYEIYGELLVPIVSDVAFAKSISLETGIRYAQYDNSTQVGPDYFENTFYNTSWKFGADWTVNDDFRLTAMFQRAVRAPTLEEIGLPRTASTGDLLNDPCDNEFPVGSDPADNAALTALCEATGVPVGAVGNFTGIISGQINNFLGGNPDLQPEEADTWTVGFDWTPAFLDGLEVSIDYYDIQIDNAIVEISEQNIINGCYKVEQDPSGFYCSRIFRDPTSGNLQGNPTNGIDRTRVNAALETATGIDFALAYGLDLGSAGLLNFGLDATYVIERGTQDRADNPLNDCVGLAGKTCLRPTPEWAFVETNRWTSGPVTVQLQWRFIDSIAQDALNLTAFAYDPVNNPEGVQPEAFAVQEIGSQSYFDLAGSYAFNDHWTVWAGINNLFDRSPPIVGGEWGGTTENSANTYPATYDVLGRAYFIRATATF